MEDDKKRTRELDTDIEIEEDDPFVWAQEIKRTADRTCRRIRVYYTVLAVLSYVGISFVILGLRYFVLPALFSFLF